MTFSSSDALPKDTKSVARDSITDDASQLNRCASAPGVIDDVVQVIDHQAERRLCRRFDLRLLPVLALMCMLFPTDSSISLSNDHRSLQCSRQRQPQ